MQKLIQIKNALRYLLRGDFKGLLQRLSFHRKESAQLVFQSKWINTQGKTWGILTTPHTLFLAQLIAERLSLHGINSEIMTKSPASYDHEAYFVLCAQMFKSLPPSEKRIIFQLEQSVSSRWFTPQYFDMLHTSVAVLEYSITNMQFLAEKKITYPHVHYLPIGASLTPPVISPDADKLYDFIFYGDSLSSPRRRAKLVALQKKFRVKICTNLFGEDMHALIRQAKAVINIHYYENALLEMPRIQECISLGIPVLSESSADQSEYPELHGAVTFFESGSEQDMLEKASALLAALPEIMPEVAKSADASARRFTFMFDRCLVALGVLPATAILQKPIYLDNYADQATNKLTSMIALSLPETVQRRQLFTQSRPENCVVFDGIRNGRGWIGCGSSFSALAKYALDNDISTPILFEDDVLLPTDYLQRLDIAKDYLATRSEHWDLFSGMIASVHADTKVHSVDHFAGMTFATIDKMTSTVFNIYNRRALELLVEWDPSDTIAQTNTIDRYLQNQSDMKVVVALPFLVGHREDMSSSLWGFDNEQYTPMINEAEARLTKLAQAWTAKHRPMQSERQPDQNITD